MRRTSPLSRPCPRWASLSGCKVAGAGPAPVRRAARDGYLRIATPGLELLHQRLRIREKRRATADRRAERLAEMAQRRVANFRGRFRDVVPSIEEQFRRAFDPDLPHVLRDGHAQFLGEKAAEIKGTATDLSTQRLDVGRFGQVAAQNRGGPLDPLAGDPFLALAEEFLLRRGLEEDLGKEFERLGLVPEFLGGQGHGRLAQRLEGDFLARRHRADGGGGTALVDQPAAQGRMEVVLHRVDLRFHVVPGKLDRDEGMGFARGALRFEIGVGVAVKADGAGLVTRLGAAVPDRAGAAQLQREFDPVAMKAPSPVDRGRGAELVVFDADPLSRKGAVKLSPAFLHLRPSAAFVSDSHKCLSIKLWQMREKSTRGKNG